MEKWVERYNHHRLMLRPGLEVAVNWDSGKSSMFPWRVWVFGKKIGGAATLEKGKSWALSVAQAELEKALLAVKENS